MKNKFVSKSEKETAGIAADFVRTLRGGEVVSLEGNLGSGKTTFVRGLAVAFGIYEPVRSPTFTLMHVHKIKNQKLKIKNLVHIDAYRLCGGAELRELGIEEYIGKEGTVTLIEWGDRVMDFVGKFKPIRIFFEHGKGLGERCINLK